MKKDAIVILELTFWPPKIKKEVCGFYISFFIFKGNMKKKPLNMVFLMLDLKFKSFSNIFIYWL
jgi:hypothetical protein